VLGGVPVPETGLGVPVTDQELHRFGAAGRNTTKRIGRTVRGRPGRLRRDRAAYRLAMPEQHRVRGYEQAQPAQRLPWQPMQQRGRQHPAHRGEPHALLPELTFQHRDSMPQGKDLNVLPPSPQAAWQAAANRPRSTSPGASCRATISSPPSKVGHRVIFAVARRRAASVPGGDPNWRRYSRLNCEGLS
jgi:hypothetical protein